LPSLLDVVPRAAESRAAMADGGCGEELDVHVGDLVDIGGRRCDVVSNNAGGVALEPAVTKTLEELRAEDGGRPFSQESSTRCSGTSPATQGLRRSRQTVAITLDAAAGWAPTRPPLASH
jgi:hypothetical protein